MICGNFFQDFEASRTGNKVAVMLATSVLILNISDEFAETNKKLTRVEKRDSNQNTAQV